MKRNGQSGFTIHELILAIIGLGSLVLVVLGIYVLAHFIAKFW